MKECVKYGLLMQMKEGVKYGLLMHMKEGVKYGPLIQMVNQMKEVWNMVKRWFGIFTRYVR